MGRNHARGVRAIGHELAGVVDAAPGVADEVARTHGAHGYTSFAELRKAESDLEAVVIATPTVTHEAVAVEALEAGLHVLVEKPVASDLVSAQRILDAARKADRVLAVGHIERHNPIVAFAKRALDDARFGRPITLSTRRVSRYPGRIRDVGCILDIGIHDIDVLNHLAGEAPTKVFALGGRHNKDAPVEDHAYLLLSYANGLTGAVEVNWLTPRKVRKLSLTCDQAFVECDYMDQCVEISRSTYGTIDQGDLSQIPIETHVETVTLQKEEPLLRELRDFTEAIRDGRPPLAGGRAAIDAVAVAHAALRSIESGRGETPQAVEVKV